MEGLGLILVARVAAALDDDLRSAAIGRAVQQAGTAGNAKARSKGAGCAHAPALPAASCSASWHQPSGGLSLHTQSASSAAKAAVRARHMVVWQRNAPRHARPCAAAQQCSAGQRGRPAAASTPPGHPARTFCFTSIAAGPRHVATPTGAMGTHAVRFWPCLSMYAVAYFPLMDGDTSTSGPQLCVCCLASANAAATSSARTPSSMSVGAWCDWPKPVCVGARARGQGLLSSALGGRQRSEARLLRLRVFARHAARTRQIDGKGVVPVLCQQVQRAQLLPGVRRELGAV